MERPPRKAAGAEHARRKPSPEFLQVVALCQYQIASLFAGMLERPFWYWEQKRTQLGDCIQNEWSNQ